VHQVASEFLVARVLAIFWEIQSQIFFLWGFLSVLGLSKLVQALVLLLTVLWIALLRHPHLQLPLLCTLPFEALSIRL